jgi:hypothetical protein
MFLFMCLIVNVGTVGAVPIALDTFPDSEILLDFESISSSESITTQFSGLGVTFSGGLFGDPFPNSTIQGSMEATNYLSSANISNPITAFFSQVQRNVGFLGAGTDTPGSTILLSAYLGSDLVDQSTFIADTILPGGTLPSVFVGLEVLQGFDRIEISRLDGNGAFSIDDFRYVPEPATAFLLGLGSLLMTRRRRF